MGQSRKPLALLETRVRGQYAKAAIQGDRFIGFIQLNEAGTGWDALAPDKKVLGTGRDGIAAMDMLEQAARLRKRGSLI